MNGSRVLKDEKYKVQYFSSVLRTSLLARVSQNDGAYPWESREWQDLYPHLSSFLVDLSEECESRERFALILREFYVVAQSVPWLANACREAVERDLADTFPVIVFREDGSDT